MADRPAARARRITSFDVAEAAGVSQSTVSRALAGDPVVSEATRLRVAEAARRLAYQVDENAARLRTGRTGTIALIVICRPGEDRKDLNPFTFSLLGSICAASSARGYETLVSFQDGSTGFDARYQEQRKADGLIVIGTTENAAAWDHFRTCGAAPGVHWVCWGSPFDDLEWARSDNWAGARAAADHLIEAGYRRIACIGSQSSPQRQFAERYEGYAARLGEAGLTPRLIEIDHALSREEQGRSAARALLALPAGERPDAVFAVCDQIALGVLSEMQANGIAVPEAIGVVGFDGIRAGAYSAPTLTTIEPDFAAAGIVLVGKLLGAIAGDAPCQSRIPVQLLARASTRRS